VVFFESAQRRSALFLLAPIALAVTTYLEVRIIGYSNGHAWLVPAVVVLTAIACGGLLAGVAWRQSAARITAIALATGLAALLLPPLVWSQAVLASPSNGTLPTAIQGSAGGFGGGGRIGRPDGNGGQPPNGTFNRPAGPDDNGSLPPDFASGADGRAELPNGVSAGGVGAPAGPGGGTSISTRLLDYLEANRDGAEYLLAVQSSHQASSVIISTGEPVMAMGGFSGSDPAMTVEKLADLVEQGKLRFVLLQRGDGIGRRDTGVTQVIESVGKVVDVSAYGGQSAGGTLYDLQGLADALRAAGGN
jgi:4-amino-4-deoxy-L-arabinose transferase-like glycosyltransferase